jgi:hypothetical protein
MNEKHLIAQAITAALISPNVSDANLEAANLVDVGDRMGDALWKLARTDDPKVVGTIEAHGQAMKEAAGIIADALYALADAVREHGNPK